MKRVLIVDDDPSIRKTVEVALRSDFDCTMATNGEEALQALRADPAYDCVILDYEMPGMNGQEVLDAMKADETLRDIKVLILTADESIAQYRDLMQTGAAVYVYKPFELRKFIALVSHLTGLKGPHPSRER
jgi:CheY-like chemotaxis protein